MEIEQTDFLISETPLKFFQGDGYVIQMPTNWLIVSPDNGRTGFMGPQIGPVQAGLTISPVGKTEGYLVIAAEAKADQIAKRKEYETLEEQVLSKDGFNALIRYYRYYELSINLVIYQRQLFVEVDGNLYILTSSQPNNRLLVEFDKLFVKMFNSFVIGQLDL